MHRGPWTQTYTGVQFYPLDPQLDDIVLEDIAQALSMLCRFNGHCSEFYSVAQHSVLVSRVCEDTSPMAARWGLLHDASEAYVADLVRPIKAILEDYRMIEDHLMNVIARRFFIDLSPEVKSAVHRADEQLLATEVERLMAPPPASWELNASPLDLRIDPLMPKAAKRLFLDRFDALFSG